MINIEKPPLDELVHSGVKGMKWGHHKKQDEEEKKRKIKKNIVIATAVGGSIYVYKKNNIPFHYQDFKFGTVIDINSLSTKESVIKKGSKFYRVSSKSFEDYVDEGKRIYVANNKAVMPDFIKQWERNGVIETSGGKAYQHVLKTKKDVKVASKKNSSRSIFKSKQRNKD